MAVQAGPRILRAFHYSWGGATGLGIDVELYFILEKKKVDIYSQRRHVKLHDNNNNNSNQGDKG